jgi:branched-chain amino acid transport system ATP-binding protein
MSAEPLLDVRHLKVAYHRIAVAVHDVTLQVQRGAIVALVGNNGAGKTTTLRAISGFIGLDDARIVSGSVVFESRTLQNPSPAAMTALGVTIVPERDKVFPNLTVAENLGAVSSARARGRERRKLEALVFDIFPALAPLRSRLAGLLSGGERQMLALGSALVCNPSLLLVDELSLGLAPRIVDDILKRLVAIRDELGITILLVEQNASAALGIADYGYVLENGRISLEGTAEKLRSQEQLRQHYLGIGSDQEHRAYRTIKAEVKGGRA